MSRINKVILVGNVGTDPDIRRTADGRAIANVSLATSYGWRDKATGENREEVEWHKIVAFNRLAEIIEEYVSKGSQLYIEGRLQTRKWQDQSGNDRYTTEIVASEMQMLGGKSSKPSAAEKSAPAKSAPASADDFDDDDIPF